MQIIIFICFLITEAAFAQQVPNPTPDVRTGFYRGQLVTYEVIDGLAIWDGDIIIGTEHELLSETPVKVPKAGSHREVLSLQDSETLWPGGVIPYQIDPNQENPNILAAIEHWEQNTPIRFVERTTQENWVFFTTGVDNCASHLGMIGGQQSIFSPGQRCDLKDTVHEIGHAVGLLHEHTRNDRDCCLWISPALASFSPVIAQNSEKIGDLAGVSETGPYDYGSIMHYALGSFMRTIPPGIRLSEGGQRFKESYSTGLSPGDIDGVHRLYGSMPTKTTITANISSAGLQIEVDGEVYDAPYSFDWVPGSIHTISVPSPQPWGADGRYTFANWSDGGAQSHSVTATHETTVFIANFIYQNRSLRSVEPPDGGTIRLDPPSLDGFYPWISFLTVTAEPAEGFSFVRWGEANPEWTYGHSVNPAFGSGFGGVVRAVFTTEPRTLTTIDTNWPFDPNLPLHGQLPTIRVDGKDTQLPTKIAWEPGSKHMLDASSLLPPEDPRTRRSKHRFKQWSDGGAASHEITVPEGPSTITLLLHDPPPIENKPAGTGKIIEATVPHFGFPASLFITPTGVVPPPQLLEVRNAGSGILNYRIDTDQPWLSVFPNQGSVLEETDTIEIHANPANIEVGSFEGFITIAEQQSALGLESAQPVEVPVTLIILPREGPITHPHPTGPAATLPGKPPAPTVSTATPYSLTVEWTEPENTGTTITDYDVQYREVSSGSFTGAQHEGTGLRATLTGLSPDTVYEVQVRATNATGTGAWSESGEGRTSPLQTGDQTYYFPHLAVGDGWQTTITYLNYSSEEVICQTDFLSDQGSPLMVSFADKGTVVSRPDVLPPGGSVHQETNVALSPPLVPGWARATCSGPVKASLLYRRFEGGVPTGEAGVNAVEVPATRFITFAEQGEGQPGTGVAYANPSPIEAVITFTARDADGQTLASEDRRLSAGGHDAQNMAPLFGLSSFSGSLEVTSTAPIVSLSINTEAARVFSSLPPGDLDAAAQGSTTYYFPHLAVGDGWQTTITYLNYSSEEVICQTDFLSDQGSPLMVSFADKGTVVSRPDVLPPGGSVHQETNVALSPPLVPGWARATCSGPVKASLLYRRFEGGVPTGEAGVNAVEVPATRFITFAEQGEGQPGTGVAYANPSPTEAVITFTARDADGQTLASEDRRLSPGGHDAQNMAPLFGLSSFSGSLEVTSTAPIVSLSINTEAARVFSSLPPGDLDAAAQGSARSSQAPVQATSTTPYR